MPYHFSVTASAPGKLMLLGEYAVLHGELCIVAAINKRIRVRVSKLDSQELHIQSELGDAQYDIKNIPTKAELSFVTEAVREFADDINCGLSISIESDIPHSYGLGSSAATTAATVAAITKLIGKNLEPIELFLHAKNALDRAQKTGSGADLAASIFGGTIAYRKDPFACSKLANNPPISVIFSGAKTPTLQMIEQVKQQQQQDTEKYTKIYTEIGRISHDGVTAINNQNWDLLARLFSKQQNLMQQMQLCNDNINKCIAEMANANMAGKISGAGLGDCVIGINTAKTQQIENIQPPQQLLDIMIDDDGILYDSE